MSEYTVDDQATDSIMDDIHRRGWYSMMTEWYVGPGPRVMAAIQLGDAEDSPVVEAEGDRPLDVLEAAWRKAVALDSAP